MPSQQEQPTQAEISRYITFINDLKRAAAKYWHCPTRKEQDAFVSGVLYAQTDLTVSNLRYLEALNKTVSEAGVTEASGD